MARRGENIYKRKDGRWEVRVIKGHDEKGKTMYAYFYGRTYKEVKDKIFANSSFANDLLASKAHTNSNKSDSPFFGAVLDLWLERKRIMLKESSYVKYFNLINAHIKPSLGEYSLSMINSAVLNKYIADKHKTGRIGGVGGLSEKTLKDIVTIIKATLSFAKDEGLQPETININLTLPRDKSKEMRVLTKAEQSTFEKYLCACIDINKLGVLLCLYTGLRIGEICSLRWLDISLENRTLTVNSTIQRVQTLDSALPTKTKVLISEPKSVSSLRTIPLPDFIIDKMMMFRPANLNAYFLTGEVGRYVEPRTYQNRFKSYIAAVGIVDANFHSTRHSFATRCVEVGFEIKTLSEILGHANVNITLNRYVHPSFDLKRSNMNKLAYLH